MKISYWFIVIILGLNICVTMQCDFSPTEGTYLQVYENQCMGCGDCPGVCDADAIRIINNKAVIDPTKCVECGKCVEICPVNAIH